MSIFFSCHALLTKSFIALHEVQGYSSSTFHAFRSLLNFHLCSIFTQTDPLATNTTYLFTTIISQCLIQSQFLYVKQHKVPPKKKVNNENKQNKNKNKTDAFPTFSMHHKTKQRPERKVTMRNALSMRCYASPKKIFTISSFCLDHSTYQGSTRVHPAQHLNGRV